MSFDARTQKLHDAGIGLGEQRRQELEPKLDFIFGPPSIRTNMKRKIIAEDLDPRLKPHTASLSVQDLERLPIPDVPPHVRYNITPEEILRLTAEHTPNQRDDLRRVLRYAMVWSGVSIGSDASASWLRLDPGHEENMRYPRVTLPIDHKRLSLRAVPQDAWGDSSSRLGTPFTLKELGGGKVITMKGSNEEHIVAAPQQYFVGDSVQTPAYLTKRGEGEYAISTNSLQRCSHRCGYCCRGYHTMTDERFNELINLTAPELARYIVTKFDIDDWTKIKEVAFITGVFANDQVLLRYLEEFGGQMKDLTNGSFDPKEDKSQSLKVSSHLLRDEQTMRQAKALGVNSFTFTVEMADDARRAEVMPIAAGRAGNILPLERLNTVVKGNDKFGTVLKILGTAIDVFGADNVEPVMVIGLDPLDTVVDAMDRLKAIGIKKLNRGLNNVYDVGQHNLIRMPFEDAVVAMQYAKNNFDTGYRQIVDRTDRNVSKNTTFAA